MPSYPNFRPANDNQGGQKKHKYPKRLNQNQEKQRHEPVQFTSSSSNNNLSNNNTYGTLVSTSAEKMYNERKNQDRETRNRSPIKPLRNFNNWIKGVLIYKYVPYQGTVLDLSCGKGGDLFKYHFRNIKSYVGVDIALSSLRDCIQRYNEGSNVFKFPASLIHADAGKDRIEKVLPKGIKFDAVSCQFAIHYMFDSEEHARNVMLNVTDKLKLGGKFIVTTPDAYVLVKKLRNTQGNTIKNEVFEATFLCEEDKSFSQVFGNRYDFQLVDAVDKCPEYLVPPKHFVELAKQYGLYIVENLNFHDFYDKYNNQQELKLNVKPELKLEGMTDDQWSAIYLYRAYVFEKKVETSQVIGDAQETYSPPNYRNLQESDIIRLH
ncbi:hypothetical protein ABK040_007459 [Willaertia magna]